MRLTIKVQWVEDVNRKIRPYEDGDPVYVGETFRLDATAKDANNQQTVGSGDLPRWGWEPDEVAVLTSDRGFNPRGKALDAGRFWVTSWLDGVESNVLWMTIKPQP